MTPESPRDGAGTRRACLVSVEERVLGVEVGVAREVLMLEGHTRVPGAPPHVLGVVNRRGTVLPILDLRPLLSLPPRPIQPGARALVVQSEDVQVGLLVDRVLGLEAFETVQPLTGSRPEDAALLGRGLLPRRPGEAPALLLDLPAVLDALRIGRAASGAEVPAGARSPSRRAGSEAEVDVDDEGRDDAPDARNARDARNEGGPR
jgi:purine-binding chemotaxis protein CheW